jgi:hypothetical protein
VYTLTISEEPSYLHAIATGTNNEEAVRGYLSDLLRECIERECFRVLVEGRLEGPRVAFAKAFAIVEDGARSTFGKNMTFAYVDAYAGEDLMRFIEDVAVNRGMRLRVFPSVSDAKAWLTGASAAT